MKPSFIKCLFHPICIMGLLIFIVGFGASVFALVVDLFHAESHPYQGVLTFALYPSVMFLGIMLTVSGFWHNRRQIKKLSPAQQDAKPFLDLSNKKTRRIILIAVPLASLFILTSIVGAYRAYEFTESPEFCGDLCHLPMGPQYVAYQDSPHANVACATCHVGHGVDNYVNAKVSGLRQLYQMTDLSFHRPIHAPHDRLLPANETCEHCHRAENFLGVKLDTRFRFSYDILNSKRYLQILLNTGAGVSDTPNNPQLGIHWHTHSGAKVTFKSVDGRKHEIPWIKVQREDGSTIVYKNKESETTDMQLDAAPEQTMDCLDCHNRPAHQFFPPDIAIDNALQNDAIDSSLPYIKKVSIEALSQEYDTTDQALEGIHNTINTYYTDHFDGKVLKRKEAIDASIAELQKIYKRNIFPDMEVDWGTYPDNIGHRTSPGCFRCHGGDHVSDEGIPLRSDCNMCHTFYQQERGALGLVQIPSDGSTLHPFANEEHNTVDCWTCHQGDTNPYDQCATCHEEETQSLSLAPIMQFECSTCHTPGQTTVTNSSCTPCHPTVNSPLHENIEHGDCISCHTPHQWKSQDQPSCLPCHEKLGEETWGQHHPGESCSPCHDFTNVLSHMKGLPISR